MELITVREIFAQPDAYMDKEVTVGAGFAVSVIQDIWIYRTQRWN